MECEERMHETMMIEAPLTADGSGLECGKAYRFVRDERSGCLVGKSVLVVGMDPSSGRAFYVEPSDDLIQFAPSELLVACNA